MEKNVGMGEKCQKVGIQACEVQCFTAIEFRATIHFDPGSSTKGEWWEGEEI